MSVNSKEDLLTKEQTEAFYKPFKITSIARADLINDGYDRDAVLALTDEDMERFASKMADAYLEDTFWMEVQVLGDEVFEIKRAKIDNED